MSHQAGKDPALHEVIIDNETFCQISYVDGMRPFFMSIVSDSNHWMFIASNGGLTAGRKNVENALFPYYTDDKLTESTETTGSKSIFRISRGREKIIWEPFSIRNQSQYDISRNLYKSINGNKILFEEVNHDLNLRFRYQWAFSNIYGFVRSSSLHNESSEDADISLLDGLQNILPYGVNSSLQNQSSNLVDAYKRTELVKDRQIAIFSLSAMIVDKAEPSEALKANIAYSLGLDKPICLLSSLQLDNFRKNQSLKNEYDIKAERGAYFVSSNIRLPGHDSRTWTLVANVNQDVSSILSLTESLNNEQEFEVLLKEDVDRGTQRLIELNAASDGLQLTSDGRKNLRHFSNSLFNIMRGGIFDNNYQLSKRDLKDFVINANKGLSETCEHALNELPEEFSLFELRKIAGKSGDPAFQRLCMEYLPLKFSRRHGDPSRPWNRFSINTRSEIDGSKILDYEGNWRDIFQNWEALGLSYPEFLEGMIFRFLNASTFDGYNPYRIMKNGIDWEKPDPEDPWANLGYWGDHQIIYLLKLLELSQKFHPGQLQQYFTEELFVYANVPYRIKPYEELLSDPHNTILFDEVLDDSIEKQRALIGEDSALLQQRNGEVVQVNLIEKLLATLLAKMANFIPEGGIWMNTQRPEWNDANNALVGNGVSMVTLGYMVRFFTFMQSILDQAPKETVLVSAELSAFLNRVMDVLNQYKPLLSDQISDADRKLILDGLGQAGSDYRNQIYSNSFGGNKVPVSVEGLIEFIEICQKHLKHSLEANRRTDDLFHAYNLMTVNGERVEVSHLSEMLEGQVSALSSGHLSSSEALAVLDALRNSALYRPDQNSYLLYPDKDLPGFLNKNNVPTDLVSESVLLKKLAEQENSAIIKQDTSGNYHFNGNFRNAEDLQKALELLSDNGYEDLVKRDRSIILSIFERVFNHKAFTGRSGTFYGYEGLGSIYWHMVSKLALAAQECCLRAIKSGDDGRVIRSLVKRYYDIAAGLGVHKSPDLYGAFPTDPYSHTPAGKGAQQPGMTGQVKEDILCRFGELGIAIQDSELRFEPTILKKEEFLSSPGKFNYVDVKQNRRTIDLEAESLCFTYCQTPIIYHLGKEDSLKAELEDGTLYASDQLKLDPQLSSAVFTRSSQVVKVMVELNTSNWFKWTN